MWETQGKNLPSLLHLFFHPVFSVCIDLCCAGVFILDTFSGSYDHAIHTILCPTFFIYTALSSFTLFSLALTNFNIWYVYLKF